jgi:hypothetical protein
MGGVLSTPPIARAVSIRQARRLRLRGLVGTKG